LRSFLRASVILAAVGALGLPAIARAEPLKHPMAPDDGAIERALADAPFISEPVFRRPQSAMPGEDSAMATLIEADFQGAAAKVTDGLRGLEFELSGLVSSRAEVQQALDCLTLNIYHEARNEPASGMAAVAHVVMNRLADPRFPKTVCQVVQQGGERIRHRCQFSWWCDGRSDRPRSWRRWAAIKAVAKDAFWGRSADPTGGALWYHADYVSPYWGKVFQKGPQIGHHIFYHDQELRTPMVIQTARANGANRSPAGPTN